MGLGLTYIRTGMAVDLVEGLHLTRSELSSVALPQLIFQSLASPLVGWLTVRLGASRVLAAAATLFAFVFFGFSRIDSLTGLYVVIAGVGLCAAGMGDITVGHVISQWFKKNRGLALGIAYAGSNLGGSLIVAIVAGRWTARYASTSASDITTRLRRLSPMPPAYGTRDRVFKRGSGQVATVDRPGRTA